MNNLQAVTETFQASASVLPDSWMEKLFLKMEIRYGSLWVDRYGMLSRDTVKNGWAEELAGYTGEEIKRGLDGCASKTFPPTLPEFLMLCRPLVDAKAEWAEACEQMRLHLKGNGEARWSRPEVYWAAIKIGAYDLNVQSWEQIKTRWINAITNAKSDPVPEFLAPLPAPGKLSMTKETAEKLTRELGAIISAEKKDPRAWVRRTMENPDCFPSISIKFAQEILKAEAAKAAAAEAASSEEAEKAAESIEAEEAIGD